MELGGPTLPGIARLRTCMEFGNGECAPLVSNPPGIAGLRPGLSRIGARTGFGASKGAPASTLSVAARGRAANSPRFSRSEE